MDPKLLVTGGLGFIGSHFIRHILKKYSDYKIVNLDKMTYAANPENLSDIEDDPRYFLIKGDICDEKLVNELVTREKPDMIINFAAESHVDRSILGPTAFLKTDIFGTYTLLEAARKNNVGKFLQVSTDEVYGSVETGRFKEDDPLNPASPYSASKASADLIVRSYFTTYKTPVVITRSSNNFGPNQYPEKIIPLFIVNLIEGRKAPVYGDGLNVRDWLYVQDNCEAIDFVLHKGREGEIYNIGGGNELTNLELTRRVLGAFGKDESWIEYVKDRPGHDRRYSIDCSKIQNELGWRPRRNFDEMLAATVNWYKENESWWFPLLSQEYQDYYKKQYEDR